MVTPPKYDPYEARIITPREKMNAQVPMYAHLAEAAGLQHPIFVDDIAEQSLATEAGNGVNSNTVSTQGKQSVAVSGN